MAVTVEQQRAIALAKARRARAEAAQGGQNAMGIAKNLGAGVVEGVAAIPTAPRDIGMLAGQGVTYGIDRLRGMTPQQASAEQQRVQQMSQMYEQSMAIPSPLSLIQRGFESYVKPMLPEAKTTTEKYARTIGQFAPAALAPGSAIQRTANVVVPAVASEAAGQATEGTSAEPVARLVGALAGGRIAAPRTTAIKETAKIAPTEAALKKKVSEAYQKIDDAGVTYNPRLFRQNLETLKDDMVNADLDISASNVFNVIDRMRRTPVERMTPGYLDKKHSQLGRVLADPQSSGEAKLAASLAREKIMEIVGTNPLRSASGKTGPEVAEMTRKARELASAKIRSEDIGTKIAQGATYQSGEASGIRNQMSNFARSLLKNKNRGWSKIEVDALNDAAKGNFTTNVLNVLGRFGFDFSRGGNNAALLPGLGAAGGFGVGGMGISGLLGAVAVPSIGSAARFGARRMTKNQAETLQKVIMAGRTGQAAGISTAERKNAEALIRQLVSSGQATALGLLDEEQ